MLVFCSMVSSCFGIGHEHYSPLQYFFVCVSSHVFVLQPAPASAKANITDRLHS